MSIKTRMEDDKLTFSQKVIPAVLVAGTAVLNFGALYLFYLNQETALPSSWGSSGGVRDNLFEWLNIITQSIILSLIPAILGYLILRRRPGHPIGLLLLAIALAGAFMTGLQEFLIYGVFTSDSLPGALLAGWIANWLWIVYYALILIMLAIFPDGRFLSRVWRRFILTAMLLFIVPLLLYSSMTTPMASAFQVPNPYFSYEDTGLFTFLFNVGLICMLLCVFLILAQIVARYWKSRGRERQQMKWLLAGMGVMALMVVSGGILSTLGHLTGDILITFSPLAPLLGIGVALLRYRLYDIDIIIRRTLQYGLLTAVLIAVYFGVVLLVQTAFVAVTGQESPIAIVISTLVIAALFNPLRRRLQSFIDRRFYRYSYDAAYTLRQFAQTARDEVDLEQLSEALLLSIQETMQPETAVLWLRSSEKT
jgi:hypothetical protein